MKLSSRKELLKEAELELEKIREASFKSPKMRKGVDYEKYGHYIYDPDISQIDYEELRKKDPTLPKEDPRGWKIFRDETLWSMEPYVKWLYFSDELGSYASRKNLYYGAENSNVRKQLMKRLDPLLLTKKQRMETDPVYNIIKLRNELPKSFIELVSNKNKWGVVVRYLLGKLLYAMQED
jgi:hypothetical protein